MSEMTDLMNRKIFLEICMGIERLCSELYNHYGEIYMDVPEAACLWKKTAMEEENHQKQFELALRLIHEVEFDVPENSLKRAYAIQYKLLKLMNHIKSNKPDLATAVSKALEMEEKLADLHVQTSLTFRDQSMQQLFKALSEADREHVTDMKRYQTILHLPHSEMRG